MEKIVSLDDYGRIYIPCEIRKKIASRKFIIKIEDGRIVLIPVDKKIDKYFGIIKVDKHLDEEEIERKIEEETKRIIQKEL